MERRAKLLALGAAILPLCAGLFACSEASPEAPVLVAHRSEPQARPTPDPRLERLLAASDVVVRGRVADVHAEPTGPAGEPGIHTRVRLDVARTLAGPHAPSVEIWTPGGKLAERIRRLSLGADFSLGEEVVVFLTNRRGALHVAELGLGKWSVRAPGDGRFAPDPRVIAHLGARAPSLALTAGELEQRLSQRRAR